MSDPTDVSGLVLRVTREWPWGLAVWSDRESSEPPPEAFDGAGVAAARTVIVSRVLHEVDGPSTAEVWTGEPPAALTCIYDAAFDLASGRLAVSDAAMERIEGASLPAGLYRARLCVDNADFPELASMYLVPWA